MKERKNWTTEEDQILKYLIQERGMTKWSLISQTMEKEFSLVGRNGKQCRQRYHNHLDKNISSQDWSLEEEDKLFDMQDKMGNKWALISSKLPGRTDNCVKNHFYSKLRKALRKINKKIHKHLKREFKDIKTTTLYKIIQTMENSNKLGSDIPIETVETCRKIKNQLRRYEDDPDSFQNQQEELTYIRGILEDITFFDKDIKKAIKKGNLKNSIKLNGEEEYTPSTKSFTNVLSNKSVYDEDESQCSNSDLFSSSSFDHRSFCSNRSQRLLRVDRFNCQSHSIASQSEEIPSDEISNEPKQHLYKSARLKGETKKQLIKTTSNFLSASLSLPVTLHKLPLPANKEEEEILEDKQSSSSKSGSQRSKEEKNQSLMTYKYMMEGEEPFAMRLLSPKKLTIQEKMEINGQQDDLFYGQNMQIQDDSLIMKIQGMNINGIPKLGHTIDL